MATACEIVTFDDTLPPEGLSAWLPGRRPRTDVQLVAFDPAWPGTFAALAQRIATALGDRALNVEHVGSTAVHGLPAKPVIDIDLLVADSADESAYVPALERAGFALIIREPWWSQHRCLTHEDPAANLHVFSLGCAEAERHRIFRDWLRGHPDDRARYSTAQADAAREIAAAGGDVVAYNAHKQAVLRAIYVRAFAALGYPGG